MAPRTKPEIIRLTEAEKRHLAANASAIRYPENGSYEPFIAQARAVVTDALAPATLAQLRSIEQAPASGPVIVENLPFDPRVTRGLIDPEANMAGKPNDLSETILVGMVSIPGETYAIRQEGKGLVSHLSPKRSHLMTNTGLGGLVDLGLHIENAAARSLPGDRSPDGLAIIGVSEDPIDSPGTMAADGLLALGEVSSKSGDILEDPSRYHNLYPERWRSSGFPEGVATPIVQRRDGKVSFIAAFYGQMTVPQDDEAAAALAEFRAALYANAVEIKVTPGKLLLLPNTTIFHGRRAFSPSFDVDGRPFRLVQRVFWTSSLDRFGDWPIDRGRLVTPTAG